MYKRQVHHFGVLAGYGAEAVHPYLAMETLAAIHKDLTGDLSSRRGHITGTQPRPMGTA